MSASDDQSQKPTQAEPAPYTYEVEACRETSGSAPGEHKDVIRCPAEDAQFWSVYRRPVRQPGETGATLAEWVSDHATAAEAQSKAAQLRHPQEFTMSHEEHQAHSTNLFTRLWGDLLLAQGITQEELHRKVEEHVERKSHHLPKYERRELTNNLLHALRSEDMTQKVFFQGLRVLGFTGASFHVMVTGEGDHKTLVAPVHLRHKEDPPA